MLDIKYIRENQELVRSAIQNKNVDLDLDKLLAVDVKRRELVSVSENLRAEQNRRSKGSQTPESINELKLLKEKFKASEQELESVGKEFNELMLMVPNVPTADTPIGKTENNNVVAKTVGEPTKFKFTPKNHWELAQEHDLIDKERAAKVAGSRFAYTKGPLVRLQFALLQFAMDRLTDPKIIKKIIKSNNLKVSDKPFVLVLPPAMIKTDIYKATARLNGTDVTYKLEGEDLWLNASAEHSLCPMYQGETLDEAQLPIRYLGYTTAFRREAGTYGKDMEGIFRLHQFDKLEMESFSTKDDGLNEHLFFIAVQEYLMQELGVPYRVVLKCTADIGSPNARGVDIDCWMPGQDKYRETHTADYMADYQARRLHTRVKRTNGETELVHTNDATVFSQRPLIVILENYQQEDGSIEIPKVLRTYMNGLKTISKS
ncbi:MAG: serine--tRNA ligase [Candidatus Yanofskybacteria bacterium RIFCSPLOWO2_02_FULL_47_9b]|uniref:Serine--tRNA ligase n=1 Tax=Candidatus Yanofskybacteria bacterium RIFCSPLOWO2_02_FULL_47_9b TaxID=1802708 RepID=A0A1F8HBE2_9BACT|nr:MAG: serine--tRNA ligase [Candidatus Yanofskybacteria bacterium RIFCSPLOWO2_02_FULL_47_9b]